MRLPNTFNNNLITILVIVLILLLVSNSDRVNRFFGFGRTTEPFLSLPFQRLLKDRISTLRERTAGVTPRTGQSVDADQADAGRAPVDAVDTGRAPASDSSDEQKKREEMARLEQERINAAAEKLAEKERKLAEKEKELAAQEKKKGEATDSINGVISLEEPIVYRYLPNKISINIPGVSRENIKYTASSGTLKYSNGNYTLIPLAGSSKVTVTAHGVANGEDVKVSKDFKIINATPTAYFARKTGYIKGQSGLLKGVDRIEAALDDLPKTKTDVLSFNVSIPSRNMTFPNTGPVFNPRIRNLLAQVRPGDIVLFHDILARAGGPTQIVSPIVYRVI